jgi:hypothetical protein
MSFTPRGPTIAKYYHRAARKDCNKGFFRADYLRWFSVILGWQLKHYLFFPDRLRVVLVEIRLDIRYGRLT